MSKFGWSYPPGCSGTPFDDEYFRELLMSREEIFRILEDERSYQLDKWGDLDERNNVGDFLCYMKRYFDKAVETNNPDSPETSLHNIRKIVTLGIACFERFGCPTRAQETEWA